MAQARVGDYVWVEPLQLKSEFDCAIGVKIIDIQHGYISVVDSNQTSFKISDKHELRLMHNTSIDGVEDMITLGDLHEAAILRNLQIRYQQRLIYTYTGNILVAVNPYEILPIYNNDKILLYKDRKFNELPPHIFAVGDNAYNSMKQESQNQCIIISGESGAGKTESTKLILEYLATISGQRSWVEQQVVDSNPIMEAFGNAKTVRNDNSSRFGKFINVDFDDKGSIIGAKIDQYLLEKSRIVSQAKGERNYHIFYCMLAGLNAAEKQNFKLTTAADYTYLNQGSSNVVEGRDDRANFSQIRAAMKVLTFTDADINGIFQVLSALLHLGNLIFETVPNNHLDTTRVQNLNVLETVADLLKVDKQMLLNGLTKRTITSGTETVTGVLSTGQAMDIRDAFVKHIYGSLFEWIVVKLNKATTTEDATKHKSIGLLDIFGFENVDVNSFEQFFINYANERLQQFFVHHIFKIEQEEYDAEDIKWAHIYFVDNQEILDLLADKPMNILSLMDEETKFPQVLNELNATDKSFLSKLNSVHVMNRNYFKHKSEISKSFAIQHFAGAVVYNSTNFLEKNRDQVNRDLLAVMGTSKFQFATELHGGLQQFDDRQRKMTVGAQFKRSLEALMHQLHQCHPYFVRCVKPNEFKKPRGFDRELCLKQLRYSGMTETIKIRKAGYPIRHTFEEFVFRYRFLIPGIGTQANAKDSTSKIAAAVLGTADYQLGKKKIFLKHADDFILETEREKILQAKVILIQTRMRGWLERRRFLRTIVAVRLIQRRWRGFVANRRYDEIYLGFTRLQAVIRQRVALLRYVQLKRRLRQFQAYARGYLIRKLVKQMVANKVKPTKSDSLAPVRKTEVPVAQQLGQDEMNGVLNELFDFLGHYERKTAENVLESRLIYEETEDFSDYKFRLFAATFFQGNVTHLYQNSPLKYPLLQHEDVGDQIASLAIFTTIQRFMGDLDDSTSDQIQYQGRISVMSDLMSQVGRNFKRKDFELAQREILLGSINSAAKFNGYQNTTEQNGHIEQPKSEISRRTGKSATPGGSIHGTLAFDSRPTNFLEKLQFIVGNGILRPDLRDEIYCQICKQLGRNNNNKSSLARGWVLMSLCVGCFPPTDKFIKYLRCFIREECNPGYVEYCEQRLRRCVMNGARSNPPSDIELQAAKSKTPLTLAVRSMDGNLLQFLGDSATNAYELCSAWSNHIGLKDKFGFSVCIALFDKLSCLGYGSENILDAVSQCEQYAREKNVTEAKWALFFRKELFHPWDENISDTKTIELIYQQIMRGIRNGELKFQTEDDLATLLAQRYYIDFGQFVRPEHLNQQLPNYLPEYIFDKDSKVSSKKICDKWLPLVLAAHSKTFDKTVVKTAATVQSDIVNYAKSEWFMNFSRFYGANKFAGPTLPQNEVTIAVNNQGIFIVGPKQKIYREIPFSNVVSISSTKAGQLHAETFNLHLVGGEEFTFHSANSRDIRDLINFFLEGLKRRSRYLVATQDYHAREVGDLSLDKGDVVELDSKEPIENIVNRRWILGRNLSSNKSGEFPTDAVSVLPVLSEPDPNLRTLLKPKRKTSIDVVSFDDADAKLETPHTLEQFSQSNFNVGNKWHFNSEPIKVPLLTSVGSSLTTDAIDVYSAILDYMGDKIPPKVLRTQEYAEKIFRGPISQVLLRDELYCQLMKQLTDNPKPESENRGWQLMWLATGLFSPSNVVLKELTMFLRSRPLTSECSTRLHRSAKVGSRKTAPHVTEFDAAQMPTKKLVEKVQLPDDTEITVEMLSNTKGKEFCATVANKLHLKTSDGFSIFVRLLASVPDDEMFYDVLNKQCGFDGEHQVLFLKKIWTNTVPGQDRVADIRLHYYQELKKYLRGYHQCGLEEATRLAALIIRSTENFKIPLTADSMKKLVPEALIGAKPFSSWESDIFNAYNSIKITTDDAKIAFLNQIYQWPTFGSVFFDVKQSGDAKLPESLLVAINKEGIHLIEPGTKDILATYPFTRISNWSSKSGFFSLIVGNLMKGTRLLFETSAASVMDELVSSYVTQIFEVTNM